MKKGILKLSAAVLGFSVISSVHAGHLSDKLLISAKLDGTQEVPSVTTNALGVASFTLNSTWDTLCVNISVNGLSGAITGIHVHEGEKGMNGGAVTDLTSYVQGNRIIATLTGTDVSSDKLAKYLSGGYYVNVHTAANPGGEIRGQLMLETDWAFRAKLDTMQQNNPVSNNAWGLGNFNLSHDGKTLKINVVADGLSGAITAAHLHYGKAGVDGGAAVDLSPLISGNTIVGEVDATTPTDLIDSLLAGSIYINIHTTANPSGEIRGQLWLDKRLGFDAWLNTAQQTTAPTGSSATGAAYFSLNTTLDTLWYEILAESLSGAITGIHLHDGAVGTDGGALLDFTSSINGNSISGMATGSSITSSLVSKLLTGNTYVNIHTSLNAAGEIRGQVYRVAREGYTFSLEGNQEVPSQFSVAKGSGIVSVDRDQSNAHYMVVVSDLTGAITGAHFHKGVWGENGGAIHDISSSFAMTGVDDAAFGYWKSTDTNPFTTANSVQFRNDSVYVNVHTGSKPNGEVRGQVLRGSVCYVHQTVDNGMTPKDPMFASNLLFSAKLTGDQEVPVVTTNALGVAGFLLNATRDTLWVNVNTDGLSGASTLIHVHEGAKGVNGAAVSDLTPMLKGATVRGFLTTFDLNKYVTGAYYVNVHTAANPNGEIRGQIMPESPWTFMSAIDGSQEVPAVTTNAIGQGVYNLSKNDSLLQIRVVATGLSGKITGAHLHMGAKGSTGGAVEDLTPFLVGNSIVVDVNPKAYLADLKAGNIYINLHTAANAGGEIRGQLELVNGFVFDSWLNGAQSVPQTTVPGKGVAAFWFNSTWDTLTYNIVLDELSDTISSSHIHNGKLGTSGGVDVDLTSGINGNVISGMITASNGLSSSLVTKLLLGESYINVHTSTFPGGEIRGQVYRTAHDGYIFDLCGDQEVPKVTVSGNGGGIFSVDRNHGLGHLMFTSSGLTGSITGAHIHNAAFGSNGGALYDVTASLVDNSGFTYLQVDSAGIAEVKASNTYLNLHTAANANGELRGQIDNSVVCPDIIVGLGSLESNSIKVYPNPISTTDLVIEFNQNEKVNIKMIDAFGKVVFTNTQNLTIQRIDMSNLASGIYFLEVTNDSERFTQKVIKN